jgi:putative PIN family toxin of toxin-antitoxin system
VTVVFNTNVLIAAVITEGLCSTLLRRARAGEFELVVCPFILNEVKRIFSKKLKLSRTERLLALTVINEAVSRVVKHNITIPETCIDRDDDNVIACAVAAGADYLVTGDSDLLVLKQYENITIISPRDFEALFV